ncbi:MAG: hypothetical protein BAA01_12895 [Bacillus thermozeamaize]|uniref:Oxidoreductase n=1 Tax=Bacillus thermozeamaize TaxID=230954 RepID=A0A1Y3PDP9_9BACI|nr:MAG: hypothetical protein BAA01_12895 [Bacillus thermozeamaize]
MGKKLRVSVIGLGVMGQQHTRIYSEMPNVELVSVYDINREHAERTAKQYGIVADSDPETLFGRTDLDAVSICVSDDQHHQLAIMACKYGKHVLIEKPLADDLEEARDIVRNVRESGIKMMVGHTLRWDPRYYQARNAVQAGKLGEIIHLYARRNNTYSNGRRLNGRTSVAMFLGVHDVDAIEWITGDRIISVYAVEVRKRMKDLGVADAIQATFRFASGAIGQYETSWVMPDGYSDIDAKLDITGTNGALNIRIFDQNLSIYSDRTLVYPDTAYCVDMHGQFVGIMKEELSTFVRSVLEDQPLPITVEEACRAVQIVHCMEQSLKTGQVVEVR